MKPQYILMLILFWSSFTQKDYEFSIRWTVWNVGQGQWSSWINSQQCFHIDMGGEKFPKNVLAECRTKKNRLSISHWDLDHISWMQKFYSKTSFFCIENQPFNQPTSRFKNKLIAGVSQCQKAASPIHELNWNIPAQIKDPNSLSRIYMTEKILIPGDSTIRSEKIWAQNIRPTFHYLLLGHHGSRTSTSEQLLEQLSELRQAIVSSRYQKYRHPHPQVRIKLQKYKVPLISTEDWGNITFYSYRGL